MSASKTHALACQALELTMGQNVASSVVVTDALGVEDVALWVTIDRAEVRRRRLTGLGAITSTGAVELMCTLPLNEPVAICDLNLREQAVIEHGLPAGLADVTAATIVRRASPALRLNGVVVVDDDWDRGLTDASRFANQCARMLVMSAPACDPIAQLEAAEYGIGLVGLDRSGELSILVAPARPRVDVSAFEWGEWEEIYGSSDLLIEA